jgi:hypothetical protein
VALEWTSPVFARTLSLWERVAEGRVRARASGAFHGLAAFVGFRHGHHATLFTHLPAAFMLVHCERNARQQTQYIRGQELMAIRDVAMNRLRDMA